MSTDAPTTPATSADAAESVKLGAAVTSGAQVKPGAPGRHCSAQALLPFSPELARLRVVLSARNQRSEVARSLDANRSLSDHGAEIVVRDLGSDDQTVEMVRAKYRFARCEAPAIEGSSNDASHEPTTAHYEAHVAPGTECDRFAALTLVRALEAAGPGVACVPRFVDASGREVTDAPAMAWVARARDLTDGIELRVQHVPEATVILAGLVRETP